jgi:Protein of unknown function (DUF4199)
MLSLSSPQVKGIITGLAMVLISLVFFYQFRNEDSLAQYLVYGVYATGIVWTLFTYSKSEAFTGRFADNFQQGFKCFIIVVLIMVVFTFIFQRMHPEFAAEYAEVYRQDLIKKGGKAPGDIQAEVDNALKNFSTLMIFSAIFGYLIIGAVVTAALSAMLIKRK